MRDELEPQHETPSNGENGIPVGTVVPKVIYIRRKSPKHVGMLSDDDAK